jgi:hypothetical protein
VNEQEHKIDLATALGEDVPDVTRPEEKASAVVPSNHRARL